MGVPFSLTEDGYESQFQVSQSFHRKSDRKERRQVLTISKTNYLSHWLLTYHLLPLLLSTAKSAGPGAVRIVNLTSDGHSLFAPKVGIDFKNIKLESSSAMTRYGQSKLANVLHAKEFNKRYGPRDSGTEDAEIWVAAVHPGHINTYESLSSHPMNVSNTFGASRNLNVQSTAVAPPIILRAMVPIMQCLGVLDNQAKGALSSLFAIASPSFKRGDSGAYIVPYAKIGKPSEAARDGQLAEKLWSWTADELTRKGKLNEQ